MEAKAVAGSSKSDHQQLHCCRLHIHCKIRLQVKRKHEMVEGVVAVLVVAVEH